MLLKHLFLCLLISLHLHKIDLMKKLLLVFIIAITIVACSTSSDGYTLNGKITGELIDSTKIYLKAIDSTNRLIDIDTTMSSNGTFKFTGDQSTPSLNYIVIDGIRGNFPVIIENGNISFSGQKDSLQFATIAGTPQNEFFSNFLTEQRSMQSIAESMQRDLRAARNSKDSATMNSLRDEFFELQEKSKQFSQDFIKENPSALISALLLQNLLRAKSLPATDVKTYYDALTEDIKATKPGKAIAKELANVLATEIGATAPSFSGPSPDGNTLALSDVKGKLVLVDFWAAWCKPCRAENPNIVSVYNKYKEKGFNVIGVSLDRKSEDWLKAIEADGLAWNHISNLKYFNDPIAKMYNVNGIPAAFLLDENGVIVGKNLRGPALEQKVAEFLN